MGNNHDKYFGADKRKILILGLDESGKTSNYFKIAALLNYINKGKVQFNTPKTKNLNIQDIKIGNLLVSFFDLAGGERQRVFWKQQYEGTQGIIFTIDVSSGIQSKQKALLQLDKLFKSFDSNIPFAIGLSKIDVESQWSKYKTELTKNLQSRYPQKKKIKVYQLDYRSGESVKSLKEWLLHQTKPI